MANFVALIILAGIGSLFGPVGFWIGLGIGVFAWVGAVNDKNKAKSVPPKQEVPVFTGSENKASSIPTFQSSAKPSSEQAVEYATAASYLYAYIFCFYPVSDTSKVDEITELLRNDDWIVDKSRTLDELAGRLLQIQIERRDSPMLFKLHSQALLERILRLPMPMKSRMLMQLDSLFIGFSDTDPKDCKDFVERFRQALRRDSPVSSARVDAEAFIMSSGDHKAISTLQEMRRNPSRYKDMLRSGATGNTVLKTAFGVFAGMLAADAVKAAVTNYQKQNLLTQLDKDIEKAGGLDNVQLEDKELESFETPNFSDETTLNFDGVTDADTLENESANVLPEEESTEATLEDDSELNSNVSEVSGPEIEVADSGSDFSFDYD